MDAIFTTDTPLTTYNKIMVMNAPEINLRGLNMYRAKELLNREEVEDFLENLANTPNTDEEEREHVGLIELREEQDTLIVLSPVKMALHIGRYDLIEDLIKNGHKLSNPFSLEYEVNDEWRYLFSGSEILTDMGKIHIELVEMLILLEDIPEHILDVILEHELVGMFNIHMVLNSKYFDGIDSKRLLKLLKNTNVKVARGITVLASGSYGRNKVTLFGVMKSILTAYLMYAKELESGENNLDEMLNMIFATRSMLERSAINSEMSLMKKNKNSHSACVKQYDYILKARLEMIKIFAKHPEVVKLIIINMFLDMASMEAALEDISRQLSFNYSQMNPKYEKEYYFVIDHYRAALEELIMEYDLDFNDFIGGIKQFMENIDDFGIFGIVDQEKLNYYSYLFAIYDYKEISRRKTDFKLSYKNMRFLKALLFTFTIYNKESSYSARGIDNHIEALLGALVAMFESIDSFIGDPIRSKRCSKEYLAIINMLLDMDDEGIFEELLIKGFMPEGATEIVKNTLIKKNLYNYIPMIFAYKA